MLTPRDIHEAEFKRVWKGYSPEEVDEFLRRVVLEYETIFKENQGLRERVQELEEKVAKYTSAETQIAVTLEVAKQAAADAKAAAAKDADATMRRARTEAAEIVARARRAAATEARQLLDLKESVERFRARAGGVLQTFLSEIDEWDIKAPGVIQEVAAGVDIADWVPSDDIGDERDRATSDHPQAGDVDA